MAAAEKNLPESITMTDGRVIEFTGKSRLKKESSADAERVIVNLDWRNGEARVFSIPHFMKKGALEDPMGKLMLKAACHGLEQKLGDETSGIDDIEDAIEAVDQLIGRLATGYDGWLKGTEGGKSMAGASILAKAVVLATGNSIEAVRTWLQSLDARQKAAVRLDDNIAPHIKQLEDEKAARAAAAGRGKPSIDAKSLLAGIGKPTGPDPSSIARNSGAAEDAPM